ncbi:hypothetical protein NIES37_58980 [Tolypothrix tenuis PCC 7101]|uniref:Bacteriocin-type signal sequence n=1 Tax=Tolypothrix tenuis PCC 7101 TaxID=231146 RepID=A0A1Z4N868_9CYAN|nr:hypothetical protein [Aulosira sp. FACHB-113]BAZ01891.1 hypothetical protein NIES37_58980 [Tolypothrix tenuis PCC 7101]BAZ74184.1 hypothetical protein NIES50_27550 [Aulosira laxa NIES-50]
MKTKKHNSTKHLKDNKIMQLSHFTELSDSELEIVVGGWGDPLQPPPPGGTGGGCTGFRVLGSI